MEIKREEQHLVLYDEGELIETYELGKEIDFSKLAARLIKKDFETNVDLIDSIPEKTEQEKNIISFLTKILEDYNKKVAEYKTYITSLLEQEK